MLDRMSLLFTIIFNKANYTIWLHARLPHKDEFSSYILLYTKKILRIYDLFVHALIFLQDSTTYRCPDTQCLNGGKCVGGCGNKTSFCDCPIRYMGKYCDIKFCKYSSSYICVFYNCAFLHCFFSNYQFLNCLHAYFACMHACYFACLYPEA